MDKHLSLYQRQLKALGIEKTQEEDRQAVDTELNRINSMSLPPLKLTASSPSLIVRMSRSVTKRWQFAAPLALACLLAVILVPIYKQDQLRVKGAFQVQYIWQRAGQTQVLKDEVLLKSGDQVSASVLTSEDSYVYWGVLDENLRPLGTRQDILSSRMLTQSGVRKAFSESWTLTEPNQGEVLAIFVCPISDPLAQEFDLIARELNTSWNFQQQKELGKCIVFGRRLRERKP